MVNFSHRFQKVKELICRLYPSNCSICYQGMPFSKSYTKKGENYSSHLPSHKGCLLQYINLSSRNMVAVEGEPHCTRLRQGRMRVPGTMWTSQWLTGSPALVEHILSLPAKPTYVDALIKGSASCEPAPAQGTVMKKSMMYTITSVEI